ncbi:MAG: hypothetical protein AAF942_00155 [Pseudomonadota bacterium]
MAYTQAQVDALEEAIASGALQVRYADRTVMYRSLDEMERILSRMKAEVNGTTRTRQVRVNAEKGFECP